MGLVLGLAGPAQAALVDQGSFDDGGGGMINLIYDDELEITWLGNANFAGGAMTWQDSLDCVAGLTVGGFTDWRLPTALNADGTGPCAGTGCTGSEMGHLFNVDGITASAPGVFSNVQAKFYWSGTEFAPFMDNAWVFDFNDGGSQIAVNKVSSLFAWAVHSGDVSAPATVPEPSTMLFFGSGIAGLAAWRYRKSQEKA